MESLVCIKCGKPVSREEMDKRYQELLDMGIITMLLVMCKECRTSKEK